MKQCKISETAIIHEGAQIGKNVIIHDYVVIYDNVIIEDDVEIWDHAVIGKPPTSPGCLSRQLKKEYPPVIIGEGTIVSPHVTLYVGIKIGKGVLLGDSCSIREECRIGDNCLIGRFVSFNYNTVIGNNTKIMDLTHITGNMSVGDNVFIGAGVITSNDNNIGNEGYGNEILGPIINDYARIGSGANLLQGVTIGRNSIVGASALVTKDVPEETVVMGIPARIVRKVK